MNDIKPPQRHSTEETSVPDSLLPEILTRRELLCRAGMGMASLGLAGMLASESSGAIAPGSPGLSPLTPKKPHFPGKAKRIIHLFMNGGPSHVDTFDPKPALAKWAGKPIPK